MTQDDLNELAERIGIAPGYHGADGTFVETSASTKLRLLEALGVSVTDGLPTPAATQSDLKHDGTTRCHLPQWLQEAPAWGITGQLYELRSKRSWGIGDFADLEMLSEIAARHGADFIGLTPLHAPFLADPERCSPFSPSNRRFLNPLYIAVDHVAGYDPERHHSEELHRLQANELVDYPLVAQSKLAALGDIWRSRLKGADNIEAWRDFEAYKGATSLPLESHALFEALSARMVADGHGAGWSAWPEAYRDPKGEAVQIFAEKAADEVGFHLWLQFLAERQLANAAQAARDAGMRIGLYLDLAVGDEPDGSATWSAPESYVAGATIGAPPDYFTTQGQDWGIAALSPIALQRQDCAPFEDLIADVTRHAGALRIDHVMALWQLFLVPARSTAAEGAHLRYPFAQLLRRLARLSHDRQLVIIGEDLGHVPEGFREVMQEAAILSYRILYFEQSESGFRAADDYPRRSIACLATHDLPTFRGWWQAHDVELRLDYGLIDSAGAHEQRSNREKERQALATLLLGTKPLPPDWQAALDSPDAPPPASVTAAVHEFLSFSNALLAGIRIADLTGENEPTNLPGTSGTYPNWRRRMPVSLEELENLPLFRDVTARMAARRPRQ